MAQYHFLGFRFDTNTFHLYHKEARREVRPKTAQFLAYLIDNRDRVISKKELFKAVWQSEHVQDHTLFQIVSEIRKLAPNEELIRTQPNLGYRWVAETHLPQGFQFLSKASVAAGVAILSITASAFTLSLNWQTGKTELIGMTESDLSSENAIAFPALSAYSKAVVALERGEHKKAEELLRFSLSENPESLETQLLLAETLYQQNNFKASEHYARFILEETNPSAYITSATSDLLSRVYQKQGSYFEALTYAENGAELLDPSQAQCTYEVIDQRIRMLNEIIDQRSNQLSSSSKIAEAAKLNSQRLQLESDKSIERSENQLKSDASQQSKENTKSSGDCENYQSKENKEDLSACFYDGEAYQVAFNQKLHTRWRNV